jgi:hypothetical protein
MSVARRSILGRATSTIRLQVWSTDEPVVIDGDERPHSPQARCRRSDRPAGRRQSHFVSRTSASTPSANVMPLRDAIAFSGAHEVLANDFELKRKGTRYAIAKVRSDAARLALKGYKMARLSEQTPEPVPVPHMAHLDSLKRALARRRRPKVVRPPAETPVSPVKTTS